MVAKKKKKALNKKSKSKRKNNVSWILAAIAVIAFVVIAFQTWPQSKNADAGESNIAAIVNGEAIPAYELDIEYERIPLQYKAVVSKEDFLEQMISVRLLLQQARNEDLEVSEAEINDVIDSIKERELITTDDQFNDFLSDAGVDLAELRIRLRDQLMIDKLLADTIDSSIEVTDSMVESFYEEYKGEFNNAPFDDVRDYAEEALKNQLRDSAIQIYVKQLRAGAVIQLGGEAAVKTFEVIPGGICEETPVVRMFSASTSTHGNWIRDVFDSTVMEYAEKGQIKAYHWELDTGDNLLTEDVEKAVPKSEVEIFKEHSPDGAVPLFVFGCSYKRIGNGYEADNDIVSEEREFRDIINELIK